MKEKVFAESSLIDFTAQAACLWHSPLRPFMDLGTHCDVPFGTCTLPSGLTVVAALMGLTEEPMQKL
jgi:hypothetical protein